MRFPGIIVCLAACLLPACSPRVDFSAFTVPEIDVFPAHHLLAGQRRHGLERPVGSKNEAIFPARWSKYHLADKARGSINDHLTAWGGTYRLASLLELSEEDLQWLDVATRP